MLSKSIKSNSSRRRGFSLTELVVVISIIALLLGLILPLVFSVQSHAESVTCMSQLRQLGMLTYMYARKHKGYLPHEDNGDSKPPKGCGWFYVLRKRKTPIELFHCPSEPNINFRSYKMNSLLEDEKTPFARFSFRIGGDRVLFFDGRVNNRGVRKLPKGTWKTADNRHPDGTHYVTVAGEVDSYDSGTGDSGWEDPGDVKWKPVQRKK